MEDDSWSRFSAASRRHHSTLQSRLAEDEPKVEFACPFCAEDFDLVGLCFHIDNEHHVEAKRGISVCPLCAARVGMDLLGHITIEHENFFERHRKRRVSKGSLESSLALSLLNKDLEEGKRQCFFVVPPYTRTPNAAPDPLLSSFIVNLPMNEPSKDVELEPLEEESKADKMSNGKVAESSDSSLSDKDQEERTMRSEFMQDLVLSTIFEDAL